MRHLFLRFVLAFSLLLPRCSSPLYAQAVASQAVTIAKSNQRIQQSTLKLPSGATLTVESGGTQTFASGSTLTISGALSGTPTGGTLNLSNLTLTLPSGFVTTTGSQALSNKTYAGSTLTLSASGTAATIDGSNAADDVAVLTVRRADLTGRYISFIPSGSTTNAEITSHSDMIWNNGFIIAGTARRLRSVNADPAYPFTLSGGVASGTDGIGGNLIIESGAGTGAGAAGSILLRAASVGGSGSSANSQVTRAIISTSGVAIGETGTPAALLKHGRTTLSGGTATVSASWVTTSTRLLLTGRGTTNEGHLSTSVSAATSFTITSSNASDARAVDWLAIEP